MKTLILLATLITLLALFSWQFFLRSQRQEQSTPSASLTDWGDYRDLLFVDQSLDELVNKYSPDNLFVQAFKNIRDDKSEEAKGTLKQILADPTAEVRTRILVWKALRQLGEPPPANISDEVHGVVLEVPVDNWIDTLAAYLDGRARYLNGKRGPIIWEAPEDPRMRPLVIEVVKSARSLVANTPAVEKHLPPKQSVIRVSILTYGGIHTLEAKDTDILRKGHILAPVYDSGTKLFMALIEYDKANRKQ